MAEVGQAELDKILGILWHYTPRGIPPMASSSLLLDNRPPLYSPIHSALGIGIPILPSSIS